MSIFNKLQSGSFDGLSDSEKIGKIKDILKKMDYLLDAQKQGDNSRFEGPRRYFLDSYVSLYNPTFNDLDFSFSLSADDILNKSMREIVGYKGSINPEDKGTFIEKKMGRGIIGCTGTAKVFCALAKEAGVNCLVVMTADKKAWEKAREQAQNGVSEQDRDIINGHQIIAIKLSDGFHAFDPGYKEENVQYGPGYVEQRESKFKDLGKVEQGKTIDMPRFKNHFVTAIIAPDEFSKVKSYQDVANLYSSGKMDSSNFSIEPKQLKENITRHSISGKSR